jgi:hypothetical protein
MIHSIHRQTGIQLEAWNDLLHDISPLCGGAATEAPAKMSSPKVISGNGIAGQRNKIRQPQVTAASLAM